jgi:hypothetical protein
MNVLPAFWRRAFLPIELGLSIAAGVAIVVWSERFSGQAILANYLDQDRAAIYGTVASISAALLGFLIATVTIIQGLVAGGTAARLSFARLRDSDQYRTLWRVFRWAIRALAITTALAVIGQLVDRDQTPVWLLFYVTLTSVLLASVLVARTIWILEQVLEIAAKGDE